MTKTILSALTVALAASTAVAQNFTISNPWSGTAGDRANLAGFAFKANAGLYPNSVDPIGALAVPSTFHLGALTLTRPTDAGTSTTSPFFGTGNLFLADANTPVYLDIYTSYSGGGVFTGYLGSSDNGITWSGTTPLESYTYTFSNISLSTEIKYWFAFSTDQEEGNITNFRMRVNTSGADGTAGAGRGYLVGDTLQTISVGNTGLASNQDWAPEYVVVVPEPSALAMAGIGLGMLALRLRRKH